jgi:hypothetical protein
VELSSEDLPKPTYLSFIELDDFIVDCISGVDMDNVRYIFLTGPPYPAYPLLIVFG